MSTLKKVLLGVAVGAAFGILYAPAKGSKTRRRLQKRGQNIKDSFRNIKDSISDTIDNIRDNVEDIREETDDITSMPIA